MPWTVGHAAPQNCLTWRPALSVDRRTSASIALVACSSVSYGVRPSESASWCYQVRPGAAHLTTCLLEAGDAPRPAVYQPESRILRLTLAVCSMPDVCMREVVVTESVDLLGAAVDGLRKEGPAVYGKHAIRRFIYAILAKRTLALQVSVHGAFVGGKAIRSGFVLQSGHGR
jgi:hypothetical protein